LLEATKQVRHAFAFLGICVSKKRKIEHVGIDIVEKQYKPETENIYDGEEREHTLDEDESLLLKTRSCKEER